MTGRPSDFTQDLADQLCSELSAGRSLRSVCNEDWAPSRVTVFRWLRERDDFRDQYARAKEEAADALADDIIDIADDGTNDYVEQQTRNGTYVALAAEHVQRSKLRVDARKWIAAKLKPKKYGDKVEHEHKGEVGHAVRVYMPANERDSDPAAEGAAGEIPSDAC